MMADTPPMPEARREVGDELTSDQRAALESRQADQDRTLASVHALEAALASAAPGREGSWRDSVRAALDVLGVAAADEERNAAQPDSLLSDIARSQPRLRHRVHGLRAQYRQVRDTIAAIRPELDHQATDVDVADLRQRLAWLLTALRHQRARESDLIYAAYYEAFDRDLERDARSEP
jgi:chromosome segregation ATPase